MKTVAICSMKGGVGKTTAAVNLSYFAAAAGRRVLLWDLDPQGASSFAYRVKAQVPGFGSTSLEHAEELAVAVKETGYENLDLLPADFAYRKIDRQLARLGKPEEVMGTLLQALGREYDILFLDCPPGFSLLTEGVFAAVDAVLVPTIPTVLSLRAAAKLVRWAGHVDARADLAVFFSMVDRRKALHRRACEWAAGESDVFMAERIPYASVVEQLAVRRMPLAAFAGRDAATIAFADVWAELEARLARRDGNGTHERDRWVLTLRAVESLIARVESAGDGESGDAQGREAQAERAAAGMSAVPAAAPDDPTERGDRELVHTFDTPGGDLRRAGYELELRERPGCYLIILEHTGGNGDRRDGARHAEVQIDAAWTRHILSGVMSPLAALERRTAAPASVLLARVRALVIGQRLRRIESRVAADADEVAAEELGVSS